MEAADQPAELAFVHDAFELERSGASTDPDPRRLAAPSVVVVEACCDGAFIVALLARRELRDAQHNGTVALQPIYGLNSASVSRLLSRLVDRADGVGSAAVGRCWLAGRPRQPPSFELTSSLATTP